MICKIPAFYLSLAIHRVGGLAAIDNFITQNRKSRGKINSIFCKKLKNSAQKRRDHKGAISDHICGALLAELPEFFGGKRGK